MAGLAEMLERILWRSVRLRLDAEDDKRRILIEYIEKRERRRIDNTIRTDGDERRSVAAPQVRPAACSDAPLAACRSRHQTARSFGCSSDDGMFPVGLMMPPWQLTANGARNRRTALFHTFP
jgi:hypothetical protein